MAYEIKFFGHCNEGRHNKIWGYACVDNSEWYSFWGRVGGDIAIKRHASSSVKVGVELDKLKYRKSRQRSSGSYKSIEENEIDNVWLNFSYDFEHALFLAKISDNFRVDEITQE